MRNHNHIWMLESQINFAFIKRRQFQSSVERKVPSATGNHPQNAQSRFFTWQKMRQINLHSSIGFQTLSCVQNTGLSIGKAGRNELKSWFFDTITVFSFESLEVPPKKLNLSIL